MTLTLAKNRRIDALKKRSADRVLVEPAAHFSQVKLPYEGSVADRLMEALSCGADVDQLAEETGWSNSTVVINLYKVAKKSGVGIRRQRKTLHMILPAGSEEFCAGAKVVNPSANTPPVDHDVITIEARAV